MAIPPKLNKSQKRRVRRALIRWSYGNVHIRGNRIQAAYMSPMGARVATSWLLRAFYAYVVQGQQGMATSDYEEMERRGEL